MTEELTELEQAEATLKARTDRYESYCRKADLAEAEAREARGIADDYADMVAAAAAEVERLKNA